MADACPWMVTGGTGLLGAAFIARALDGGAEVVATHQRHEPHVHHPRLRWARVDHADVDAVARLVEESGARAVLHAAAMAIPADAERDPGRAATVNAALPAAVARACASSGARMLHVSTDLVFDGRKGGYVEGDAPCPISVYGRTKADAEEAVARACADHVVARTSLLLGPSPRGDRGMEELLVRAVERGERPALFLDEVRTPVGADDLARVLWDLGAHPFRGVLHATGSEAFTRHALGVLVMESLGFDASHVRAARIADGPPAVPPRAPVTTLDTSLLRSLAPAVHRPRAVADVLRAHPRAALRRR